MAKSIALAPDASRLASLLLSYIPAVCAFVAPRQPGASAAIIDRLSHSRALRVRRDVLRAGESASLRQLLRDLPEPGTLAIGAVAERGVLIEVAVALEQLVGGLSKGFVERLLRVTL